MKKWMSILGTCVGGGLFLLGGLPLSQAETLPIHPGTRLLKSGKLVVEIDDPAAVTHNRFNRSARRFSPVAIKFRLTTPPGYSGPNALTVIQTEVKQSLTIEASLPSNGVDLWCTDRQLSPEMLVLVALNPGQEKRWTRTYTFSIIIQ